MVAKSSEDGEEAGTCVNGKRPKSSRNFKMWGAGGSTSNNGAVYSAACLAKSNGGPTYIRVGKLNLRLVKVLRDTRCTGKIAYRALVPAMMCDNRLFRLAADGRPNSLIDVLFANVYLESLYYRGHCRKIICSYPVYLVITGIVRGARQMLPDPDHKAEDQQGARARTSVDNNYDNDDQAGCSKRGPTKRN